MSQNTIGMKTLLTIIVLLIVPSKHNLLIRNKVLKQVKNNWDPIEHFLRLYVL
jgi:hypothetical protein